jgi:hypothetical protein
MTDGAEPLDRILYGKIIGIDALLINALVVCEDEAALRLCGARYLAADALEVLHALRALLDKQEQEIAVLRAARV